MNERISDAMSDRVERKGETMRPLLKSFSTVWCVSNSGIPQGIFFRRGAALAYLREKTELHHITNWRDCFELRKVRLVEVPRVREGR